MPPRAVKSFCAVEIRISLNCNFGIYEFAIYEFCNLKNPPRQCFDFYDYILSVRLND